MLLIQNYFASSFNTNVVLALRDDGKLIFVYGAAINQEVPLPDGETRVKDFIMHTTYPTGRSFMLTTSGKVYITKLEYTADQISIATWAHCEDLDNKVGYFGTLSSQSPTSRYFNLIVKSS